MTNRPDIWKIADAIQMDLRTANAKLVELRAHLSALQLPDSSTLKCPTCDLPFKGPNTLAEHIHVSHNGPLPDHWAAADARARDPEPDPDVSGKRVA